MTDTEKLTETVLRSLPRIPDHLKKAVEELFTPANIAISIDLVLMALDVGEVLGLLAVGFVAGGRLEPVRRGGLLRLFRKDSASLVNMTDR